MLIAQNPKDFLVLENEKFKLNPNSVSEDVVYDLAGWSSAEKEKINDKLKLPDYDFLAVFTSYNIIESNETLGDVNVINLGVAFVNTICTSKSVALIKYMDFFGTIRTTSHELAHAMNSNHDGEENDCKKEDDFVMAPSFKNYKKIYRNIFSECTHSYMEEAINRLDSNNSNCLASEAEDFNLDRKKDFLYHLYPGQIYDLDDQCKLYYGPNSLYCGGDIEDQTMCQAIRCYDGSGLIASPALKAMDGTTCSNRAWCLKGICTLDSRAPRAPERCVNGDRTLYLSLCTKLVNERPDKCKSLFKNRCCASCDGNRTQGGCQDTIDACAALEPRDCYNKYYATTCCKTCSTLVQNQLDANCLYGDRGDGCSKMVPEVCHLSTRYCCQTCTTYFSLKKNGTEPTYDDSASPITPSIPSATALVTTLSDTDSATSSSFTNSFTNASTGSIIGSTNASFTSSCKEDFMGMLVYQAEWGNRWYSYCEPMVESVPSLCYNNEVQKYCCASCGKVELVKDYCIDGDHDDLLSHLSQGFQCSEIVKYRPQVCMQEATRSRCCKSCGRFTVRPTNRD